MSQRGIWDHIQEDDKYFHDKNPVQTPNETTQKETSCSCSLFNWFNWFSDILILLSPPRPLYPSSSHIWAPSGLWVEVQSRAVCVCVWCVSACLSEGIGKEGSCRHEVAMWVTPPSAGPWSPGPPEEWWRWFSPTPRSVTPEGRLPPSPGPSSPRMEGSGSSLCPPMPSYSGSAACPAGKRTGGKKKLVFSDSHIIRIYIVSPFGELTLPHTSFIYVIS